MVTSDINYKGSFGSIEAVWAAYPYGGIEGDYLLVNNVKYRWNKYVGKWENAEVVTETPARETITFDGDVNMQNDLTVAGVLRAKKFVVDDLPTGIEEVEITESAVSGGNNVITITYTNGESQTFNIKNGEAGKTMGAFGFASSTASQSTWNTAKNYLVPTANEGEFNVYSYEADAWSLVDTFEVSIAGTAGDVEYDDTTTQLDADNVQEAIEALNNKTYPIDDALDETSTEPVQNKVVTDAVTYQEQLDLSKESLLGGYINANGGWTASTSSPSSKTTLIRVFKGERYKIYARDSINFYTVLRDFVSSASATPQYATGYSGRVQISEGDTIVLNITSDNAMWLCVRNDTPDTGTCLAPVIYKIETAKNDVWQNKEDIKTINDELYFDDIIAKSSLTYRYYIINSYQMWGTSTQARNHYFVPVETGQRYKIQANTFQCFYAFLKSDTLVADTRPDFCYGYEQRYGVAANTEEAVTIPADCNYLYLSRTNQNDDSAKAFYAQKGLNNVGYQELKDRVYSNGTYYYYGERIILTEQPMYKHRIWWDMSQNKCQSAAAFGNYLFKVQDFNETAPRIVMYNLETKLQVAIKEMAHRSEGYVHCNQSSFGTQYYDENDPFPLLYISQQEVDENGNTASWTTSKNKNMRSVCEVYRLIPTMGENDYNALDVVKVQTIYMPVITATNGLGRMNIGFDLQNNLMYAQSRDVATGDSNNYGLTYISLFKSIPPLRDNSDNIVENVYLTEADVRYTFPIYELGGDSQGNCIYNGKMYIARGSAAARAQLYIVNLVTKKFLARLDLGVNGFAFEPEGVFIYNDNLYIVNVKVSRIELR